LPPDTAIAKAISKDPALAKLRNDPRVKQIAER
jgi:hypothetical protein